MPFLLPPPVPAGSPHAHSVAHVPVLLPKLAERPPACVAAVPPPGARSPALSWAAPHSSSALTLKRGLSRPPRANQLPQIAFPGGPVGTARSVLSGVRSQVAGGPLLCSFKTPGPKVSARHTGGWSVNAEVLNSHSAHSEPFLGYDSELVASLTLEAPESVHCRLLGARALLSAHLFVPCKHTQFLRLYLVTPKTYSAPVCGFH